MKRLSICHVSSGHNPTDNRIYKNQAISLQQAGYNVSIVTPQDNGFCDINIKFYAAGGTLKPLSRLFLTANKVVQRSLSLDADIYHLHDIELLRFAALYKRMGKKVIFDCHENWIHYPEDIKWLNGLSKAIAKRYIKYLYGTYLPLCDMVIGVSPHITFELKKYNNNVHMVTNYPRIDDVESIGFDFENYSARDKVIIYTGTVSDQENIIRSLSYLNDVSYKVVGNVSPTYVDTLRNIPGFDKVEFLPYLDKTALLSECRSARLAITGLKYSANVGYKEGTLGNTKIFDYMKYGLPIACTNFQLWTDQIVRKFDCGLTFDPDDPQSIASAISELLNNTERSYQMGCNSYEAVLSEFNWKSQESILFAAYDSII